MDQAQHGGAISNPASSRSERPQLRARLFEVIERRPKPELAFASLSYLGLRYLRDVGVEEVGGRLPYGAEPGQNCLFYTVHDDPAALFGLPFLYQAQFESVQTTLAVPFDQLHEMDRDARPPATFVFSIGRCGSTLLARMLSAAGLTAISEPDVFSQMGGPEARHISLPDRRQYMAAATRCLAAYSHRPIVIKLRSHCNTIGPLIMSSSPGSRCEFIFRNRRDWARSMFSVGPFDAALLTRQLMVAVLALDRLMELGHCSGPIWYEDIVSAPQDILGRFMPGPIRHRDADLEKALSRDSQSGTLLSRDQVAQRAVSDEALNRFDDEWRKVRPDGLLVKLGLNDRL